MKKLLIGFVLIFGTIGLFAQVTAVFKEVSGKVEVSDAKAGWIPAKVGMAVSKGTTISTGFKAKATIALGDSVVLVKQLTRMRLDELVEKEGTVSTELFLDVGKVTAQVKTASGKKNDFRLKSPISTAAVRGTVIEFSQDTVTLLEGSASAYNELGRKVHVGEGGSIGFENGFDNPSGEDKDLTDFTINPFTGDDGGASKGKSIKGVSAVIISLVWQ